MKIKKIKCKNEDEKVGLPRLVFSERENDDPFATKSGQTLFHVLAATMDVSKYDAGTYALAIALYLDETFDRESIEKYCVVLDVQAG